MIKSKTEEGVKILQIYNDCVYIYLWNYIIYIFSNGSVNTIFDVVIYSETTVEMVCNWSAG